MNYFSKLVFSLSILILTINNSNGAEPLKVLDFKSPHCPRSEQSTSPDELKLKGLKGPVKSVKYPGTGGNWTLYQISKEGKLTSTQNFKADNSSSEFTNQYYDNIGRLTAYEYKGKSTTYKYPDSNTVVSRNSWEAGDSWKAGWRLAVSKYQNNNNGDMTCVYAEFLSDGGLQNLVKTTQYSNGDFFEQQLFEGAKETLPSYGRQMSNEPFAFKIIEEGIQFALNLKGTLEECNEQVTGSNVPYSRLNNKYLCSSVEKIKDGKYDRVSYKSAERNGWFYRSTAWLEEGFMIDRVNAGDKKLTNNKLPHHFYNITLDEYGNWIKKLSSIEFDTAEGVRLKEDKEPEIREIEYY